MKFGILIFSPAREENSCNFLCWMGNQGSDFTVSEQETAMSIFCSSNLSFSQNQPMKFEILTFLAWFNQIGANFPGLNWKPGISFTPNFLWAFQYHKIKLVPQFLVEPMYLLEKTKQWATEILSKIWIAVSNSAYTKIVKFLRAGEKVKI